MKKITHPFLPIIDKEAKILILGSFPSVVSRKESFYYMHPQNRFYKVLSSLFHVDLVSSSTEEKIAFFHQFHIALYDVVYECEIENSSDASIRNVKIIELENLLKHSQIQTIFLNGKKAYALFKKFFPQYDSMAICLPSTSPANATYSLDRLLQHWQIIKKVMEN